MPLKKSVIGIAEMIDNRLNRNVSLWPYLLQVPIGHNLSPATVRAKSVRLHLCEFASQVCLGLQRTMAQAVLIHFMHINIPKIYHMQLFTPLVFLKNIYRFKEISVVSKQDEFICNKAHSLGVLKDCLWLQHLSCQKCSLSLLSTSSFLITCVTLTVLFMPAIGFVSTFHT